MVSVDRTQTFAALAVVASCWLTASTFLLRMPLIINWFTRMTAILLVITTVYTAVQVSFVGDVSAIVLAASALCGAWVVAVGYVFRWPSVSVWASNLLGGFVVLVGTGYLLYRRVEAARGEPAETLA